MRSVAPAGGCAPPGGAGRRTWRPPKKRLFMMPMHCSADAGTLNLTATTPSGLRSKTVTFSTSPIFLASPSISSRSVLAACPAGAPARGQAGTGRLASRSGLHGLCGFCRKASR